VPVFNTVAQAVESDRRQHFGDLRAAMAAAAAIVEAGRRVDPAGCLHHEGIPVMHMSQDHAVRAERERPVDRPNCPGLITPGSKAKVGIIPGNICSAGRVGLVPAAARLPTRCVNHLTRAGIGPEHCVGIGGDPDYRHQFHRLPARLSGDTATDAIVMIGEIGGTDEQNAPSS
jgi:succinyl-CoA synthetase alpha subunit